MKYKSVGFVGGGRVVKIILSGLRSKSVHFEKIFVSDINSGATDLLKQLYPEIITLSDNKLTVRDAELVFLSVHPNVLKDVLNEIRENINKDSVIISLAPKFSIKSIKEILNFDAKIVRLIPNANSYTGLGFNPVCFSDNISDEEKSALRNLLSYLGDSPEVNENKLEAYAVITGMGPTYFWFQFETLLNLATEFGLSKEESEYAIKKMVSGSVTTLFDSGLKTEEVKDLVPVKPLLEKEKEIEEAIKTKLKGIYSKLTK